MANRPKSKKTKSKSIPTQQPAAVVRAASAPKASVKQQLHEKKKLLNPTVLIALLTTFLLTQTPLMIKSYVDKRTTYDQAAACFEAGNYDAAIALWAYLEDYMDCKDRIAEAEDAKCEIVYQSALSYQAEEKFEEARKEFLSIPDYKDASDQADLCVTKTQETAYAGALEALDICDYETAILLLKDLGTYENAEAILKESAFRYASDLTASGMLADAIHYYSLADTYEDAADKLDETRYAYGNQLSAREDYKGAVSQYEKCKQTSAVEKQLDAAKHAYIDKHFTKEDPVTRQYLDELTAKKDKEAKAKSDKLYK